MVRNYQSVEMFLVMHNLIVEDGGQVADYWFDNETPRHSTESNLPHWGVPAQINEWLALQAMTRDYIIHTRLQEDLIEHICTNFDNH